jgi:hypothetical protein
MNVETVVEAGKWASLVNHIKNNRIEYLVLALLAHTLGLTQRVLDQTSGVCL